MKYSIIVPCDFDLDEWFNIGIDFWPQHVTANHKETREERVLIDLKGMAVQLDNRYIKSYEFIKLEKGKVGIIIEV